MKNILPAIFIVVLMNSGMHAATYYSHISGKRVAIVTTKAHFKDIGPFNPAQDDPPITHREAYKLASKAVRKLVPEGTNRLEDISLSRDDSLDDRWLFLVRFSNEKTGDTAQIVVLFDKTVLKPK